ncbi:MAG: hypothetical protein VKJ04_02045 [Vampirovibrionales bacterium]|nr:hypothetical protein [Vampirovibrionales bacterium]
MMMNFRLSRAVPIMAALPLSLAIFAPPALAASRLASIEFNPTGAATNIQFRSETVLPYHIAYNSDTKLMIDIDNVASEDTIDTEFLGASEVSAISNVVIQPTSKDSLRLIIRGEHLASPKISFIPIRPKTADGIAESTEPPLNATASDNTAAPVVHQAPAKANINQNGIASDMEEAPLTPMAQSDVKPPEPKLSEDPVAAGLSILKKIETSPYLAWTPYIGLGILLLGLVMFLKRRLSGIIKQPQTNVQYETLMQQHAQGRSIGFQQLADAYRLSDSPYAERPQSEADYIPSRLRPGLPSQAQQNPGARSGGLIGLGGLSQLHIAPEDYAQYDHQYDQAISRETLKTAAPQPQAQAGKNRKAPPPARQAVNQYAQAQRSIPSGRPQNQAPAARKSQFNDEQLRQELQQATRARYETKQQLRKEHADAVTNGQLKGGSHLAQSPVHKQALKQRQAGNAPAAGANPNAPLSGNPEVLNFLRDVAELMDKDGRSQAAKSFRKGLNPG